MAPMQQQLLLYVQIDLAINITLIYFTVSQTFLTDILSDSAHTLPLAVFYL